MTTITNNEQLNQKNNVSDEQAMEYVKGLLDFIGEDTSREGLIKTPYRVINAMRDHFAGYNQDPKKFLERTFSEVEGYNELVVVSDIELHSHCEHHMAPIIGVAHIAYIPTKKIVGLSKLARVVEAFSKRLQTQEKLTMQIAKTLMDTLEARGVAVTIDATHQCMTMRGVRKAKASTVTNHYLGLLKEDLSYQNRYLRFISNK